MKSVGIIGGIAPESTIVYYREIINSYQKMVNDGNYPRILINSINMTRMLSHFPENNINGLIEYLSDEINKLAKAGADFCIIASNTPHIVFDQLRINSPIPLISIVDTACAKIKSCGYIRAGLFGTKFTMQNKFYEAVFEKENISIILPNNDEQEFIHRVYFDELINGIFLVETKEELLSIVNRMKTEDKIECLILGGTELPLILRNGDNPDIPFMDTTKIHVEAVMKYMLDKN